MLGDFRGKSWGRSQPFSPDAEIISVPLWMFINSSRCHTPAWKCQEGEKKKINPGGKGKPEETAFQQDLGSTAVPPSWLAFCWTGIPCGGLHFPFRQEIALGIKRLLLRVSKKVLLLPVTHQGGAKSCPEPVPTARTFLESQSSES